MLCKKVVPIRPDMPRYHIILERAVYPQKCKRCGMLIVLLSALCTYLGASALWEMFK